VTERLPTRYAWLTVAVALGTFALKATAAWTTNSVGLFSDALESVVNLVTAFLLVFLLEIAKQPPDDEHPYGHDKAEYFANGVQGTLILLAAFGILASAFQRFLSPQQIEGKTLGLALGAASGLINIIAAGILKKNGRKLNSDALQGEADHLMSDVWTTVAVLAGVGLSAYTGILWLDPLAALAVSFVVFFTGGRLLKNFISGLMDTSLPEEQYQILLNTLDEYKEERGMDYHALRTRVSGARTFISFHVLVPGAWTVSEGHSLLDELEADVSKALEGKITVLTHLEPIEEECSFADIEL